MAVYYKFKCAKDYYSIPINGQFISVATLKQKIYTSNHYGRGKDFDLIISNAQTDEEYVEEGTLIPENTAVIVRRLPGVPRKPIITGNDKPMIIEDKLEDIPPSCSGIMAVAHSTVKYPEESEEDDFGGDVFGIQQVLPAPSSAPKVDSCTANKADEDSKIKALVNTPALDWNCQGNYYGAARGFVWKRGGRIMDGYGSGRCGLERKTPHAGYVCHRCNLPGHFIQHCPTNGDQYYDRKWVKLPNELPKSIIGGSVSALIPNKAASEKEVERPVPTSCVNDVPPEWWCPLCKEVMKDSVITGKCCFKSYCDKCIRAYIITNSKCFCGATNILVDHLVPNATIRETISRILESRTSSAENSGRSGLTRDSSKGGLQPSCLANHSADMKEPETPTDSLLNKKQAEKGMTDLVKEMTSERAASVTVKKEVALVPEVVEKRKRKKRVSSTTTAAVESGVEGLSSYNNYNWFGNGGYMQPFSFTNPYPAQCYYYYNQNNWDLGELWMNGGGINQGPPSFARKPDIVQNECYQNREKSCRRNNGKADAGGHFNGTSLKTKRDMMPETIRSVRSKSHDEPIKLKNVDSHFGPSHDLRRPDPSPRIEKIDKDEVFQRLHQSSLESDSESSDEDRHFKRRRKSSKLKLGAEGASVWHSSPCEVQVSS